MSSSLPGIGFRKYFFIAQAILLTLAAFLIYMPSFHAQFHLDDLASIVNNNYIHIKSLIPSSLLAAAFQDWQQNRPFTNLSFALNYYLGGLDPFGYHLVNFLVFIATALGIWMVLQNLFIRIGHRPSRANLAAWMAALVWTVHPINIQAVIYIVQRHASAAGAFSVWSIYFYQLGQAPGKKSWPFLLGSGFCCVLAILNKETALVLPALIFVFKLYFYDGLQPGWFTRNWKWGASLAVFYLACLGFVLRPSMSQSLFDFSNQSFSAGERFLTEPRVLLWYVLLIIFPFPQKLSLFHDFEVSTSFFSPVSTCFSFLAIIIAVFAAIYFAKKWRTFSFVILWYLGQLLVEALPLPIEISYEHRLYLASLSLIVPAAAWPILKIPNIKGALTGTMIVLAFLSFFTFQRNKVWRTEVSLWRDAVSKGPAFFWSWYNYCLSLSEADQCTAAVPVCRKTTSMNSQEPAPHRSLGQCYLKSGQLGPAEKELMTAVMLSPEGDASVYSDLGILFGSKKDFEKSARYFSEALKREPENSQFHFNLAQALWDLGRNEEYAAELKETLKLNPSWVEARKELASYLAGARKCHDAIMVIDAAPTPDPGMQKLKDRCLAEQEK